MAESPLVALANVVFECHIPRVAPSMLSEEGANVPVVRPAGRVTTVPAEQLFCTLRPVANCGDQATYARPCVCVIAPALAGYGSPRVTGQLHRDGVSVGRRRVARLMRLAGLQGRSARLYRRAKVGQRAFFASVPHRLHEQELRAPNQVWVGDVTYLKVAGQWRYLATVMDRHSRRIVGWSLGARRDAALTSQALKQSVRNRAPAPGLVFHSDRGVEYAAFEYRQQLQRLGILQSMNRPGKMNDNAHIESFFHSMKAEELYGKIFTDEEQLRRTLSSYIGFYNQQRLHSALRYLPPAVFEQHEGLQPCVN